MKNSCKVHSLWVITKNKLACRRASSQHTAFAHCVIRKNTYKAYHDLRLCPLSGRVESNILVSRRKFQSHFWYFVNLLSDLLPLVHGQHLKVYVTADFVWSYTWYQSIRKLHQYLGSCTNTGEAAQILWKLRQHWGSNFFGFWALNPTIWH